MSIVKPCVWCGTMFEAVDNRTKFCSDECRRLSVNRKNREYMRQRVMVEKQCAYCGRTFSTNERSRRFCSKSCGALNRCEKQTDYAKVKIKITKPLPVFTNMCPDIGSVHIAEKTEITRFARQHYYIIRGIGKYGLLLREDECEEVGA